MDGDELVGQRILRLWFAFVGIEVSWISLSLGLEVFFFWFIISQFKFSLGVLNWP